MQRRIVEPADLSGDALAELKSWLGITRSNEDALLMNLLQSALTMCEAFTRQMPLSQTIEERLPTRAGRSPLLSRPVAALVSVEEIAKDGSRTLLDPQTFDLVIDASGLAVFELSRDLQGQAVAVAVTAGLGASWNDIPAPLKQGIIRLCAYYYRDRDRTGGDKPTASPPASVSALWRPYQAIRLT